MLLITKHPWETWKCTCLEDLLYLGTPTEPTEFTEQMVANYNKFGGKSKITKNQIRLGSEFTAH